MIPLRLPAEIEAAAPYITRVSVGGDSRRAVDGQDCTVVCEDASGILLAGPYGMVSLDGVTAKDVAGDVLLVDPARGQIERLIRANSPHNTLLVTERCDQLCQMCSQPPKKTHEDRFALLEQACLLAPDHATIGITGGEPTLYKADLFALLESVLAQRADLSFHVLTNGQHFDENDCERLRDGCCRRVLWGIPLYARSPNIHDTIVAKVGAYEVLHESFGWLLRAGARVELRTVLMSENAQELHALAHHIAHRLSFIEQWSIMQLESIGFARNRWRRLLFDHADNFAPVSVALDRARLHGVRPALFNFPLCTVPPAYRQFAVRSISDWKQKFVEPCDACSSRSACGGFFEWHPDEDAKRWAKPL